MPKRSSALSRSASRWAFQVSASLGATLLAALVVQSLPRATPEASASMPELTTGGKFAARVASARAYDGLDTMPLPQIEAPRAVATASVVPAAFLMSPPADLAGLGAALRQPSVDGSTPRERAKPAHLARVPARVDARRPVSAVAPVATPEAAAGLASAEPADDGLLHLVAAKSRQVWSGTSATTREVWSATASAGSSLVSRLIP